jgi:Fur family ferric uptake transcriptional regulator
MLRDERQLLRDHGLQVTARRLAVLRSVAAYPHATAKQILGDVEARIGSVSRQTIYDALEMLTDRGLIQRIQPARSPALYENRVGGNHHHVVCRTCGVAVDVDCVAGDPPCLESAHDHGFVIDKAEVIFWGICPRCRTAASGAA